MLRSRLATRVATSPAKTPLRISLVLPQLRKTPATDALLFELPQHLELMAARLQNGENIYAVLTDLGRGSGRFALALRRASVRIRLGQTIEEALGELARELKSPLASELVNKVILSLERGTPLAAQLRLLAATARGQLRISQLKAAGRNELKMLVPLVFLILPVTVAFAILPSLQLLQFGL